MTGRDRMLARYRSLGWGELLAAAVFCWVATLLATRANAQDDVRHGLAAALAPLVVILVQAGVYWLLARRWVLRSLMPRPLARVYQVFRVLNPLALVVGLAWVVVWWPATWSWRLGLLGIWAFGVVEYLNYYVVRLSYPVSTWFQEVGRRRTPRLVIDITEALETRTQG